MTEPETPALRRLPLLAAPVALGLFSMAAQAVLFRIHLTSFGGHELGFGVFLASWLAWVGVGAALARAWPRAVDRLGTRLSLAVALYPLPAFLQALLLARLRELSGVAAFELVPVDALALATVLANAPLSLATGFLFPVACRATERAAGASSVARVYVLEALGGIVGGVGTTVALAGGGDPGAVLVAAAALATVPLALEGRARWPSVLPLAAMVAATVLGLGPSLARWEVAARWERLLPGARLEAVVQGREGEIVEGSRGPQHVIVRQGRIAAAFPDQQGYGRWAALLLAQNPGATRFLLLGEAAPGVALALLSLPDVRAVDLAEPDQAYLQACWRGAGKGPADDARLRVIEGDVRAELAREPGRWDVVAVLAGDPTTLVANRSYTREFLAAARAAVEPSGVVALRFTGGENFVGDEGAALGGVLLTTARAVFARVALMPGDDSVLFASNGPGPSEEVATLVGRLRARPGASNLFPPDALGALFLPDRVRAAYQRYASAALAGLPSENRDDAPVAHLASLLLASKLGGASFSGLARAEAAGGVALAGGAIVVLAALVALAARVGRAAPRRRRLASAVLAGVAGFTGMGASLVLLDAFQVRHGTIYLHVGLLSAAYMSGLTVGGALGLRLARSPRRLARFLPTLALALALAAARVALPTATAPVLTALLALVGAASGLLIPQGARLALADERAPGEGAARVEAWDHVGAALAGGVFAFWWVPVLGLTHSLDLLAALAAATVLLGAIDLLPIGRPTAGPCVPTAAWLAVFLVLVLGLARQRLRSAEDGVRPALPTAVVGALAGDERAACPPERGWCSLSGAGQGPAGYLVSSRVFAPDVVGYAGAVNVVARLDPDGTVRRVAFGADHETPTYRDAVVAGAQRWEGFAPFADSPVQVEAVTGATVTSEAVTLALRTSARRLFAEELGLPVAVGGEMSPTPVRVETLGLSLALLAAVALAVRPARRLRRAVLALVAVGLGLALNVQVSIEPLAGLLEGRWPPPATGFPFLLVVGVGLLVAAFGNVYCGHACPFGALQETLHDLNPWRVRPDASSWRGLRAGKYVLAALLVLAFLATGDRAVLTADPLVGLWRLDAPAVALALAGVALVLAAFVPRFFCRALCPTGALLAVLGAWRPLARWSRPKAVGRCDLGVSAASDLDCVRCDRCLHVAAPPAPRLRPAPTWNPLRLAALALVLAFVGLVIALALRSTASLPSGRDFRRVDEVRLRALLDAGELSGHRALYWKPATSPPTPLDPGPSVR